MCLFWKARLRATDFFIYHFFSSSFSSTSLIFALKAIKSLSYSEFIPPEYCAEDNVTPLGIYASRDSRLSSIFLPMYNCAPPESNFFSRFILFFFSTCSYSPSSCIISGYTFASPPPNLGDCSFSSSSVACYSTYISELLSSPRFSLLKLFLSPVFL